MTEKAPGLAARKCFATAVLALSLAGCGLTGSEPNEVLVDCPATGVMAAGETLERYAPNSERDLTDLIIRAKVGNVRNVCSVFREERRLEMDLLLDVGAERGPAATPGESIPISYFVAVVDADNRITKRDEFPLAVAFENTARQAVFNEQLLLTIPIPPNQAVSDFQVVIGLQLSREELERTLSEK